MAIELVVAVVVDYAYLANFYRMPVVWRIAAFPAFFSLVGLANWLLPSATSMWFAFVASMTAVVMPFLFVAYWFRFYAGVGDKLSVWMATVVCIAIFTALISWAIGDSELALKCVAVTCFLLLLGFVWKWLRGRR